MSQALQPAKVQIEAPATREKFAKLFKALYRCSDQEAEQRFELEKYQFVKMLNDSASLANVNYTPLSAMGVFLDVISSGLSFNPMSKHVYVMSRSVKSGKKDDQGKDIYEDRLYYTPQADGQIHLARKAKSVNTVTEPVIVLDCDKFSRGTDERNREWVKHETVYPRNGKFIAAYLYVITPNNERIPFVIDTDDIETLKRYSAQQNGKWDNAQKKRVPGNPNALYSSNNGEIDRGFLRTKLVKKAMRYFDKTEAKGETLMNNVDAEEVMPVTQPEENTSTQSTEPINNNLEPF